MRWPWFAVSVVGLIAAGVGLLWFLQGSDLVHIDPIACASDCEPIVGHQPEWQVAGAAAVVIGALTCALSVRRMRR